MNLEDLSDEEKTNVKKFVEMFPYRFFIPGDKLGETSKTQHRIRLEDEIPLNLPQYCQSPHLREEAQKQVDEIL